MQDNDWVINGERFTAAEADRLIETVHKPDSAELRRDAVGRASRDEGRRSGKTYVLVDRKTNTVYVLREG